MKYVEIITEFYKNSQQLIAMISGYSVFAIVTPDYSKMQHLMIFLFTAAVYSLFVGPAINDYFGLSEPAKLFTCFVFMGFSVYFYLGVVKFFRRWSESPVDLIRALLGKGKS